MIRTNTAKGIVTLGLLQLMKLPTLDSAKQVDNMSVEVGVLKQRVAELQQELVNVKREKTELNDKLLAAEDRVKEQASVPVAPTVDAGDGAELQQKVQTLQSEVAEKQQALEVLEQQMQERVDKAPQFKSMKDMLQKKNAQIKEYKDLLVNTYCWKDPDAQ
mmetsp:Transcript_5093/g.8187  ORF Transcript_5093/g.8187 Transcript_5093/m.8187 type:complete len:161 (+) Transcript_5093:487-969(+)